METKKDQFKQLLDQLYFPISEEEYLSKVRTLSEELLDELIKKAESVLKLHELVRNMSYAANPSGYTKIEKKFLDDVEQTQEKLLAFEEHHQTIQDDELSEIEREEQQQIDTVFNEFMQKLTDIEQASEEVIEKISERL